MFAKYKQAPDETGDVACGLTSLERQRAYLKRLQEMRTVIRALGREGPFKLRSRTTPSTRIGRNDSLFSSIRLYFSEIVESVIDRKALLSVAPNQQGHLDFSVEILDEAGNSTSADLGVSYRKLLCVAFDLAVPRAHLEGRYPEFVYHDGVLESLDDRKKRNLIDVMRTVLGVSASARHHAHRL